MIAANVTWARKENPNPIRSVVANKIPSVRPGRLLNHVLRIRSTGISRMKTPILCSNPCVKASGSNDLQNAAASKPDDTEQPFENDIVP